MSPQRKLISATLDVPDELDAAYAEMYSRGWTDGLPIIPPTEERVWRMIEYVGLPSDQVIAKVPLSYAEATVESIAVNAVMAGCKPEYMPVVIAAVEAMCEEKFNLAGFESSTNSHGVALVINGPIRKKLDVNCGFNCLGPGWRANATIGRAVNLVVLNIGAGTPGDVDKATHGYPGKYTLCFGEFEEESYWEPLHVERGFKPTDSTVSVFSIGATISLVSLIEARDKSELMDWLRVNADSMAYMGTNRYLMGRGEGVMVLTPPLTRKATEAGMTKADVKTFLYEQATIPESRFPAAIRRRERMSPVIRNGIVYPARRPEDIVLVVAGLNTSQGYHYESSFLDTFGDSWSVTKLICEPEIG